MTGMDVRPCLASEADRFQFLSMIRILWTKNADPFPVLDWLSSITTHYLSSYSVIMYHNEKEILYEALTAPFAHSRISMPFVSFLVHRFVLYDRNIMEIYKKREGIRCYQAEVIASDSEKAPLRFGIQKRQSARGIRLLSDRYQIRSDFTVNEIKVSLPVAIKRPLIQLTSTCTSQ